MIRLTLLRGLPIAIGIDRSNPLLGFEWGIASPDFIGIAMTVTDLGNSVK
jgi:hypothetical protein